jgi:hypothetical protein
MAGIIFAKGHLYADPDGDNIELAELQDCSFEIRDTTKTARGPDSAWPVAVEIAERSGTLRCAFLKVQGRGMAKLLGATATYTGNETTIPVINTTMPTAFKATLKSPSDGSDFELILYKVMPINVTIPLAMRDFTIPNVEFEIQVDANNKVCDIILPGYQSTD